MGTAITALTLERYARDGDEAAWRELLGLFADVRDMSVTIDYQRRYLYRNEIAAMTSALRHVARMTPTIRDRKRGSGGVRRPRS